MFYMNTQGNLEKKFDEIKFIHLEPDSLDPLNSFLLLNIPILNEQGTKKITARTQGRPDLLSYDLYGDTQYWWILMQYNNITDIDDLRSGMFIRYFDITALEKVYRKAAILEKTDYD